MPVRIVRRLVRHAAANPCRTGPSIPAPEARWSQTHYSIGRLAIGA